MEGKGKAMLNRQVNQGTGLCAVKEENESEGKGGMSGGGGRRAVKERLCFRYKAETPDYHSVL